ncbi:hypothetical protein CLV51_1159 [Chitinophaga niastensis]|uniref:Uncharacterized protein n=1 Tax=Chitinophaga niastensis TaxID=536980 RepID=A0A2P8H7X9_CHINA|nr:hypothetical protein [Chitinophaga niastensis]PSL42301.1 hypothetical protein CLV51_1159 [Chitinophaga niastensis]
MSIDKNEPNVLNRLHTEFSTVAVHFRNRVCEECNYSTPTFYRKMRGKDKKVEGKLVPALSNAEKDKIREIGEDVKNDLITSISGIRLKKG